jgi:hypothetical protein
LRHAIEHNGCFYEVLHPFGNVATLCQLLRPEILRIGFCLRRLAACNFAYHFHQNRYPLNCANALAAEPSTDSNRNIRSWRGSVALFSARANWKSLYFAQFCCVFALAFL